MNRFLKKMFRCGVLYCLFAVVISGLIYDGPWTAGMAGREATFADLNFTEIQRLNPDVLFVGTSRMHRHVIPGQFDKSTGMLSYNAGVKGMFWPRSLRFAERVIDSKSPPTILLLELDGPKHMAMNWRTRVAVNSMSWQNFFMTARAVYESDLSNSRQSLLVGSSALCLGYRYLGFGLVSNLIHGPKEEELSLTHQVYSVSDKGYISLDDEIAFLESVDEDKAAELKIRKSTLNQARIANLIEINRDKYSESMSLSNSLLETCNSLIEHGRRRGTKVIFMLPPRLIETELAIVFPVFQALDDADKIDLSDPAGFPGFYSMENSFDSGHLNHQGAVEFTRRLVEHLGPRIEP